MKLSIETAENIAKHLLLTIVLGVVLVCMLILIYG